MARLRDPVVGARAQRAYAVGDLRRARNGKDRQSWHCHANPFDVLEPAQCRVQYQRVDMHRGELIGARRVGKDLVIPAECLEPTHHHRHKAAVVVDESNPHLPGLGGH
jgi:hypothetical protein